MDNIQFPRLRSISQNQKLFSIIAFVWIIFSFFWIRYTSSYCPPTFSPDLTNGMKYSAILHRHNAQHFRLDGPLIAILVSSIIATALIYKARSCALPFLLFPLWVWGFFVWFIAGLCDHTILHHVASVEFNNNKYNLAISTGLYGDYDVTYESIILHECDLNNTNCYGLELETSGEIYHAFIRVDEAAHQLQVFFEDEYQSADEPIFTLDESESLRD